MSSHSQLPPDPVESAPPGKPASVASLPARGSEREIVRTLFDLGRRVTSVLDLHELLERLPSLIQRLIVFDASRCTYWTNVSLSCGSPIAWATPPGRTARSA